MVGNYNASFYSINGMVLETRKRREHLSKDDVQKNKALLENFATGNTSYLEDQQNGWFFKNAAGKQLDVRLNIFLFLISRQTGGNGSKRLTESAAVT